MTKTQSESKLNVMHTIESIMAKAKISTKQAFYYRLKISGIEEGKNYHPSYDCINGKIVRIFTESEAEKLANCAWKKRESK